MVKKKYTVNRRLDNVELKELRKNGVPWLITAILLFLLATFGLFLYYTHLNKTGNDDLPIAKSPIEQREEKKELKNWLTLETMQKSNGESEVEEKSSQILDFDDSDEEIFDLNGNRITPKPTIETTFETWVTPTRRVITTLAPPPAPSTTLSPPSVTIVPQFQRFTVLTPNKHCSEIGKKLLMRGVNSMEASIGISFCLSALEPHQGGLGGGMVALIADRRTNSVVSINGLSCSPQSVTDSTFNGDPMRRFIGYPSLAIPGTLHALWQTFRRFPSGRATWTELILPTIELLQMGFQPSDNFVEALHSKRSEIEADENLRKHFLPLISQNKTNVTDFQLADTLRRIATSRDPSQLFYRGDIANQIVREVKTNGGYLQKSDLVNYESIFSTVMPRVVSKDTQIFALPPPALSSLIQLLISKIEEKLQKNETLSRERLFAELLLSENQILTLIEEIADPRFSSKSDEFSNHFSKHPSLRHSFEQKIEAQTNSEHNFVGVVDQDGNAVALSMSLGSKFGAFRRSDSLGILWNNGLAEFSTSPDAPNSIEPRKRARSLSAPIIVKQKNEELKLFFSPTPSIQSIASIAQVVAETIFLNTSFVEALRSPKIWSPSPGVAEFEISLPYPSAQMIAAAGFEMQPVRALAAVHGITRRRSPQHMITPNCDPREKTCFFDGF
ncbi:unnamed protein product, partial [Mesorhabditis belari]|uniref:Uncharacterized protein n=1 Tax=Mesorhabditis belari TaxID=2138241 RepID=A0AAF3JC84_9BILA